jgi:hypothetical protein
MADRACDGVPAAPTWAIPRVARAIPALVRFGTRQLAELAIEAVAHRAAAEAARWAREREIIAAMTMALLSSFAECRREWLVRGKADSTSALLLDREFGPHINPATNIPLRASLTE